MAGQDWFEKDFYAVLGVTPEASADEVKKAYRKLARQHHPDANSGEPAAERRFKEVGEAYAVLSDAEQRQQYDAVRAMSRGGARFTAGGPGGGAGFEDLLGGLFGAGASGAGGGRRGVRFGAPSGAGPNLEDLFEMFGSAAGGPGGGGPTGFTVPQQGRDLAAETTLTFRQALEGAMLNLRVDDPVAGTRSVTARVPAGVRDGQKVRLRGKGMPGGAGGAGGDLVVTVRVQPHPVFTIHGNDVRLTLPVTFPEAALGAEVEAPTPDGGTVRLRVPAGTPSGRTLRVKGRGVRGRQTGDLLVTVQVAVPQRLDADARAAVEAFAAATAAEDPRADLVARVQGETAGAGDGR